MMSSLDAELDAFGPPDEEEAKFVDATHEAPGLNPMAAKDTFWRDKNQNLFVADGEGVFVHHDMVNDSKNIAQGWPGDKPGHGLVQVPCIFEHNNGEGCREANGLLCEAGMREDIPPTADNLADLRKKCEKKGLNGGWLQKAFEDQGVKTSIDSQCWPRLNERGYTWAVHRGVSKAIFKYRMPKPLKIDEVQHEQLEAQAAITDAEHGENPPPPFDVADDEVDITGACKTKDGLNLAGVVLEFPPQLPAVPIEQVQGEVVDDEGGELPDEHHKAAYLKYMSELGLDEDFGIIDDGTAERVTCVIRRIQHEIEERLLQVPLSISVRLAAIGSLTEWFKPQLIGWGEKKLDRWTSNSKPDAKVPHLKGDFKKKSHRFEGGAIFFKKIGGPKNVDPKETMEWIKTLDPSEYRENSVKEKFTALLPAGYSFAIFEETAEGKEVEVCSDEFESRGISVSKEFTYSRKQMGTLVAQGEVKPGWKMEPVNPIGQVTIGGARGFSWTARLKDFKAAIKKLTLKGEESDDGEDEDE